MKKMRATFVVAAIAGAFMMTPKESSAAALTFADLDAAGSVSGSVLLDKLNLISSPQFYAATTNVGADNTLNSGDVFTENLTLVTNSSNLGLNPTLFNLGGDYKVTATLTGTIGATSGTAIVINPDSSVTADASSRFDVAFTTASILLENNVTGEDIATLTFVSGGGSDIQLVAGQFIGDITLNALLGPGCLPACDTYIHLADGTTSIIGETILAITTGSARFVGFDGTNFATNTLVTNFQDNGEATTFVVPEPGSIALMGLSLFGLGFFRRKALKS